MDVEISTISLSYRKFFTRFFALLFIAFVILAIFNIHPKEPKAPDWTFFLTIALPWGIFTFFSSIFLVNVKKIRLKSGFIEVGSRDNLIRIALDKIDNIETVGNIVTSTLRSDDYYCLNLKENTVLGKKIYFELSSTLSGEQRKDDIINLLKREIYQSKQPQSGKN
jgi:hypothetical protein